MDKITFLNQYLLSGKLSSANRLEEQCQKESRAITIHSRGVLPNMRVDYTDVTGAEKRIIQYSKEGELYDDIFNKDIFNRYLTMHPKRLAWSKLVYTPVGRSLISSAINRYNSAIFQHGSFSFSSQHEATRLELAKPNYCGDTFNTWVSSNLLQQVIEDPNGIAVVLRADELTASAPAQPYVLVVSYEAILHPYRKEEPFLAIERYPKNKLNNTFFIIDENETWVIELKDGKVAGEAKAYKNYGFLPFVVLGGEIKKTQISYDKTQKQATETETYYSSYLSYIVQELNALCREQIHYEGDRKDVIPMRGIVARNCDTCNGTGVIIGDCGDDTKLGAPECNETCKVCNGHGHIISINQGDTLEINEDVLAKVGGNINGAVNWFNPDTNIVKLSSEILAEKTKYIEKRLFIFQSENANESGEAKKIDLQAASMFIGKLANRLFDISDLMLRAIASYMQMTATPDYTIKRNTNFQLKDETDLREEIITYKSNGMLELAAISEKELLAKQGNKEAIKKNEYFELYNPLANYTDMQIMAARNIYGDAPDFQKAIKMYYFGNVALKRAINKSGIDWFISATLEQVDKKVQAELAKINTNATIPSTPTF